MKTLLLYILLFFNTVLYAQYSQGIFTYKKDFSEYSLGTADNSKTMKSQISNYYKQLFNNGSSLNFVLKVNESESLFYVDEEIISENNKFSKLAAGIGDTKGEFYTNIDSKEIINKKDSYGQLFLVYSSLNDKIWEITNESKIIGNYKCFKATTVKIVDNPKGVFRHNVEAWFASEIPLNFGPAGYGGLPGLIIELKFQNIKFYLTKMELNPKEKINFKKPTKGKKVTIEVFNEIGKEITKDFRRN
jgi:GLPGLI family protein